nr:hypothetical protein [Tanacetum cinerariifolium]
MFVLDKDDKVPNVDQIDKFTSVEIPDKNNDPDLYKLVLDFMMHGPCGEDDPNQVCMVYAWILDDDKEYVESIKDVVHWAPDDIK